MRKLAICAAFFTLAAAAGEPVQCPNPDVMNALVFRANDALQMRWNRILPAQLGGFRAPSALTLVGSAVRRDGRLTRATYKTDLPLDVAYSVMMTTLGPEWQVESAPLSVLMNAQLPYLQSGTLCRDGQRRQVFVEEQDGVRYASINLVNELQARDCKAALPNYMPRFELPAGSSNLAGQVTGRLNTYGSSGSSWRLRSEAGAQSLLDAFAGQLVAQGWSRETGWSGKSSTGSTWRKTSDGKPGAGTLEVTRIGEQAYDVDFKVVLRE